MLKNYDSSTGSSLTISVHTEVGAIPLGKDEVLHSPVQSNRSRLLAQRLNAASLRNSVARSSRSPRSLAGHARLRATRACTLALLARASTGITSTVAGGLLRTRNILHRLLILSHGASSRSTGGPTACLPTLQIRKASRLIMNVTNLLLALRVKGRQTLSCRSIEGFFEVRVDTSPALVGTGGNAVGLIDTARSVGCLVFAVKARESIGKAVGDSVLVVKCDGILNRLVTDHVAVCKVLGHNA